MGLHGAPGTHDGFSESIRIDQNRSESMAQADKTAVCAVAAPLDVTQRAARPRGGHWGGVPRACL